MGFLLLLLLLLLSLLLLLLLLLLSLLSLLSSLRLLLLLLVSSLLLLWWVSHAMIYLPKPSRLRQYNGHRYCSCFPLISRHTLLTSSLGGDLSRSENSRGSRKSEWSIGGLPK